MPVRDLVYYLRVSLSTRLAIREPTPKSTSFGKVPGGVLSVPWVLVVLVVSLGKFVGKHAQTSDPRTNTRVFVVSLGSVTRQPALDGGFSPAQTIPLSSSSLSASLPSSCSPEFRHLVPIIFFVTSTPNLLFGTPLTPSQLLLPNFSFLASPYATLIHYLFLRNLLS
jgi:hypothetical protein